MAERDRSWSLPVIEASATAAVIALRVGRPAVLLGGSGEDLGLGERLEAHLVLGAQDVTEEELAFFLRHGSGLVFAAVGPRDADRLGIGTSRAGSAETETAVAAAVDLAGLPSPQSVRGRAATFRALADRAAGGAQFARPGHVLPIRVADGGLLKRAAAPEAAVDLVASIGQPGVAAIAAACTADGKLLSDRDALMAFAKAHSLPVVTIDEVVRRRLRRDRLVEREAESKLANAFGDFRCIAWSSEIDECVHVALVLGDVTTGDPEPPLVKVHSECRSSDIFRSLLCRCGDNLERALAQISAEGRGAVVYLRGRDGSGLSRVHERFAASEESVAAADARDLETGHGCAVAAQILHDLGVRRIRLLTDSPQAQPGIEEYGVEIVDRIAPRLSTGSRA